MWTFFWLAFWMTPLSSDALGEMIARNFADLIANRDVERASALLAPEVNFDGVRVKGEDAQKAYLRRVFERHPAAIRISRVHIMSGLQARERFGPPPARLEPLHLEKSIVLLARRKTGGLAVMLEEIDGIPGRWRVVAITD